VTRPQLPIKPILGSPGRRGGGSGEPVSQPVPPEGGPAEPWLLDSREVARLLGIGRTKTFQMMATAELPTVRIGRCVRVPRESLLHWVLGQAERETGVEPLPWLRQQPRKSPLASP
jgi:excisionase family DNA binding protein